MTTLAKLTKLPKELTYQRQGIYIMPVFLPALGISKKMLDYKVEKLAERMSKRKFGNAIRFFSAGVWEPHTIPNLQFPFLKNWDGEFDLEQPNPAHMETLKRRVQYFTDRQITVILTLIDNCSTHVSRPGFWNAHWWNGKNNCNDTRAEKQSLYHWYEHLDRPEAVSTGKYLEQYIRRIVGELDYNSPYIHYEICNEGQAGFKWHRIYGKLLKELGVSKKRRLTSLDMYMFYKKLINIYFSYSKHSIADIDDFWESHGNFFRPFTKWLPSGDGEKLPSPAVVFALVKEILYKKHKGYELNTHGRFNDMPWDHMRAMRRAWFQHIGYDD